MTGKVPLERLFSTEPMNSNNRDATDMEMKKALPDLHRQAFALKNHSNFRRDGGRAWIRDSQLYDARCGENRKLETIHEHLDKLSSREGDSGKMI